MKPPPDPCRAPSATPAVDSPTPAVSVVMPVRDAEAYLSRAVASILEQTLRDFELLVLDDGSTDRSAEIAESFDDPRIRVLRRPPEGLIARLNEGVAAARAGLIARMDADDVARPERLERQLDYLLRFPDCIALASEVLLVDPDGRPIGEFGVPLDHRDIDRRLLEGCGAALPHPALMVRRAALLEVGGYRPETDHAEDLDLFLRLAERGRLANLPDVLLEYRQHLDAVSTRRAGAQRRAIERILRDTRERRGLGTQSALPPLPEATSAVACWHEWARAAIGGGHPATARRYARAVLRAEPLAPRSWRLWLRAQIGFPLRPPRRRRARG